MMPYLTETRHAELQAAAASADDYRTQRDDDRAQGRAAGLEEAAKWLEMRADERGEDGLGLLRGEAAAILRLIDTPSTKVDQWQ